MSLTRSILLGSGSPRRKELLEAAGFDVRVHATGADESWPSGEPSDAVKTLAVRKMRALGESRPERGSTSVTADTVVFLDQEPLNKPADHDDAIRMLQALNGRAHDVITAFCVRRGERERVAAVSTRVWFRGLRTVEIERYVASGEPMDKAGAYGIQGGGGALVDRLEGSYTNVVGLPLAELIETIEEMA